MELRAKIIKSLYNVKTFILFVLIILVSYMWQNLFSKAGALVFGVPFAYYVKTVTPTATPNFYLFSLIFDVIICYLLAALISFVISLKNKE